MKRFILFFLLLLPVNVNAQNILRQPLNAQVLRVIDGDTIVVSVNIWLKQTIETYVRLRNIDTPELKSRCEKERKLALKAKEFVEKMVGKKVILHNIDYGKYAGRIIADVELSNGKNLAELLLKNKLAVPYQGKKRPSWCD